MTVTVETVDSIEDVNRNQWNHVVEQSTLGTVYHRYGWLRAIEFGTPHEAKHFVASKSGNPIAIFPNFVVEHEQLPISHLHSIKLGFGGPVATTDEEEAIQLFLDEIPGACNETVVSNQIRTYGKGYSRYHEIFEEHGYRQKLLDCNFELDITRDWEEILSEMDSSRRRAIKRGHENDFEIVDEEITPQTMSEFYDGFSSVMERVDGYQLPRSFFVELARFTERVKVLSLRADGGKRGSILLLLNDEQSSLVYEESAIEKEHFEYNSSELLHEHAIRWGQRNGYDTYNFRGAELDFRDGVFRFKEKFGAHPVPALVWERSCSTTVGPAYRIGRYLLQRYLT